MATRLVRLVIETDIELWHDAATCDPYISIFTSGHREHHRIGSRAVRDFLARLGHLHLGRAPGNSAVQDALTVLAGIARYDGTAHPVGVRVAVHDNRVVLDLADEDWRAIIIDPQGWAIVTDSPIRFRRSRGMLSLPAPVPGGSLDDLRRLLHVERTRAWMQMAGWLVGALAPRGPFPTLAIVGEQGAKKTTTARLLRGLVDPHITPLRGPVRDERDLMIAASHALVVGLDNVSKLPDWLSDALCRLASGGGFATRALFTDDDEHLIDVMRPIVLTSISSVIHRGDLLDRASIVALSPMPESQRRSEAALYEEYESLRPALLGALLDVASAALKDLPNVNQAGLPRMADHALFITAAEGALGWADGSYIAAFTEQNFEAIELQLEGDPVVQALRRLMTGRLKWEGTSSELFQVLGLLQADKRPGGGLAAVA